MKSSTQITLIVAAAVILALVADPDALAAEHTLRPVEADRRV